jgi:uncharacterized protein (TIGR03435 family)
MACSRKSIVVLVACVLATLIPARSAGGQGPQQAASANGALPSFEVASIKPHLSDDDSMSIRTEPDRFIANNVTAVFLIEFAYGIQPFQLSGASGWAGSKKFDIDAKQDEAAAASLEKQPGATALSETKLMVQSLLSDRFALKVRREVTQGEVYRLVVAKGGATLAVTKSTASGEADSTADAKKAKGIWFVAPGQIVVNDTSLSSFASFLARQPEISSPVSDATGLTEHYDFKLQWTPVVPSVNPGDSPSDKPLVDAAGVSLFSALEEQLGLKLEATKGTVEKLVIESLEEPTVN